METRPENITRNSAARREAERLVLKCGVHANLKGFSRLVDAVMIYGENDCSLCELYRAVAELHAIKPNTVIREISYALKQSSHLAKRLSELVGATFCSDEMHNGLVIAVLAYLLDASHASRVS